MIDETDLVPIENWEGSYRSVATRVLSIPVADLEAKEDGSEAKLVGVFLGEKPTKGELVGDGDARNTPVVDIFVHPGGKDLQTGISESTVELIFRLDGTGKHLFRAEMRMDSAQLLNNSLGVILMAEKVARRNDTESG